MYLVNECLLLFQYVAVVRMWVPLGCACADGLCQLSGVL